MATGSLFVEKRKHPRIKLSLSVHYKVVNEIDESYKMLEQKRSAKRGNSENISSEGLCLVCDKQLDRGDILKIEMKLPGNETNIKAFAEVVWVSDEGVPEGSHGAGLFFMALRDEDADSIGRLIANMIKMG